MKIGLFWQVPVNQIFFPARIKQWAGLKTLVIEESSRRTDCGFYGK